ncbi:MAG: MATE family efflux transporter [Senegalia sp. (in: firmicutes)]|uniref:MATE family efflux transporter n=1 Tax=Senegalia sp. (in: firmicutes) TaxID=1924098 RepID=UPI003F950FBE
MIDNVFKGRIKELNIIAFPLILQYISSMLIQIVDQAMIGRISLEAFNGINLTSQLLSLIVGILGYVAVIFNMKGSKAKGEKNKKEYNIQFNQAILLSLIISLPIMLIFILAGDLILKAIYGIYGDTLKQSLIFIKVMIFNLPIQMLLFTYGTIFKIEKKTKYIMFSSMISSLINITLDYILIFGNFGFPRLETLGNAIGSIIAVLINLIIYIYLSKKYIKYDFSNIRNLLQGIKINFINMIPFMGQEILEGSILGILLNMILVKIGELQLGSYTILYQILGIITLPMYMYGNAIITVLGEATGKKNLEDLKIIPRCGISLSCAIYFILSIIVILFKNKIGILYTENKNLINMVSELIIAFLAVNFLKSFSTIYRYSLQTIGKSKYVLYVSFISGFIAVLSMYIFSIKMNFGIYGILLSQALNFILLYIVFSKKYYQYLKGDTFSNVNIIITKT